VVTTRNEGEHVMALREVPESAPGSGPVDCCGGHRARCKFGRQHSWATWYENGKLQRTRATFHCHICGGVCTDDEAERLATLRRLAIELASLTVYPPEKNALDGPCAACGYGVDAGKGLLVLGSDKRGTFAATLHTHCMTDVLEVTS
jgi:hypothetical protein